MMGTSLHESLPGCLSEADVNSENVRARRTRSAQRQGWPAGLPRTSSASALCQAQGKPRRNQVPSPPWSGEQGGVGVGDTSVGRLHAHLCGCSNTCAWGPGEVRRELSSRGISVRKPRSEKQQAKGLSTPGDFEGFVDTAPTCGRPRIQDQYKAQNIFVS